MNELDVYIETLFGGLEGYVYSPVKTADGFEPNHWFLYPTEKDKLVEHIKSSVGDVYISPAVYNEKRAVKESIKKVQAVWVEFDGVEQIDFRNVAAPTLIVQTSYPSHVHCYWKIDPTTQGNVEDANRRLTYYLHADTSGWDSTQLLRPPGTINYKNKLPVQLVHNEASSFTLGSFEAIPKVSAPPSATITAAELVPVKTVLEQNDLPLQVRQMVKKENPKVGARSSFLTKLALELAEEGLEHAEIVSLLHYADERIQKYSGRTDQLMRLSQIADYALLKIISDSTVALGSFKDLMTRKEVLNWILPGWLHTTGLLFLSSAPNVGKTQFATQLAYCLQNQIRFLGFLAPTKHRVMFFSLEMEGLAFKYILENHQHEWNGETDLSIGFVDEEAPLKTYEKLIEDYRPTVIIFDSLTELLSNDEEFSNNPKAASTRILKWMRKIRRRYGCAMIMIHHNRKATEGNKKPKTIHDLEGSFMFGQKPDTVLQLWEEKNGIELSTVKARYAAKTSFMITRNEHLWFRRKDASDDDGSVGANPEGNSPKPDSSVRHGDEHNGLPSRKVSFRFSSND